MANKRIKDISTTATSAAADDFVCIDGSANGTRKIDARPLGGVFDETIKTGSGTFPVAALAGIQIANGASSYSYFSATDDTKQFAAGIDHTLSEGVVGMISNHGLRVVTNNTERLRVDATGQVGIGTSSPGSYDGNADDLVVATGGDTGITIRSSSAGGGNIYFADGTTGDQRYRAYVSYAHSTDTMSISSSGEMKLRAGASEAVRIDSSGDLAIGLSDPNGYKLNVNGTAFFSGAVTAADLNVSGATPVITINDTDGDANAATAYVQFQQGGTGIGKIGDIASGRSAMMLYADSGKELMLFTDGQNATSDTPAVTVDTSQRVGIGGSPSSSLHVYSSTADNLRLERDATNDWRIQLTSGALAFRDATADAERLRLDDAGRLGIGTSSPSAPMSVEDSSNPKVTFGYGGANAEHQLAWDGSKFNISADAGDASLSLIHI